MKHSTEHSTTQNLPKCLDDVSAENIKKVECFVDQIKEMPELANIKRGFDNFGKELKKTFESSDIKRGLDNIRQVLGIIKHSVDSVSTVYKVFFNTKEGSEVLALWILIETDDIAREAIFPFIKDCSIFPAGLLEARRRYVFVKPVLEEKINILRHERYHQKYISPPVIDVVAALKQSKEPGKRGAVGDTTSTTKTVKKLNAETLVFNAVTRTTGLTSPKIAELTGISESTVRKTKAWKIYSQPVGIPHKGYKEKGETEVAVFDDDDDAGKFIRQNKGRRQKSVDEEDN